MRLTSIRRRWRRRPEIFRRRWSVATPVGLHPSYVATDHRRFLTTNPGGTPLIIRGKLFRQPRPALNIFVPSNLNAVANAVRSFSVNDLEIKYREAMGRLDQIVAKQFGLSDEIRDHIVTAMTSDPILSKMRPMIAQRGLRIQPYSDHS